MAYLKNPKYSSKMIILKKYNVNTQVAYLKKKNK